MRNRKIRLYAPAKINLFLRVLGRRPDGYHDLETWMQKLDLYDTIILETGSGTGIEFSCDDPGLPMGEDNLAVKAAVAFFSAAGLKKVPKFKIYLEKKIPVAAGLGGGSSDAGTVLRGLNKLFDQPLSERELVQLARPLGADVPFFAVEHGAVIAHGVGDIMYPVNSLTDVTFVLVNPGFLVSTRWAFENLSLTSTTKKYKLSCFQKHKAGSLPLDEMHNDLEVVTSARYPEIEDMKRLLSESGASGTLMSGSGPTVFGVFPDAENPGKTDFNSIMDLLRRTFGDRVFVVRTASAGAWPSG
jgi:4-diphosphocytidyl-2-C-methyl-D-erythritol kinase